MSSNARPVSRRRLLRNSAAAAAAAAGSVALWPGASAAAQGGRAPAVVTGRRFKAWIGRGDGTNRTTLEEVTLKPIGGRQVVVRTEATNLCYSNVPPVLGIQPAAAARRGRATGVGARRAERRAPHERHGRDPGPWRRRRRRSRGPRGAARAGGRSRLRVGDAALRRLLPLPARPLGHVPVPERHRRRRSGRRWRKCATARPSTRTRTSAGWPS